MNESNYLPRLIAQRVEIATEQPRVAAIPIRVFYLIQLWEEKSPFGIVHQIHVRGQIHNKFPELRAARPILEPDHMPELQDFALDECSEAFEHLTEENFCEFIAGEICATAIYHAFDRQGESE